MGRKGAVIGQLWSASGDRLMGKLSAECLADTRQSHEGTLLVNEGPCLVIWGNTVLLNIWE